MRASPSLPTTLCNHEQDSRVGISKKGVCSGGQIKKQKLGPYKPYELLLCISLKIICLVIRDNIWLLETLGDKKEKVVLSSLDLTSASLNPFRTYRWYLDMVCIGFLSIKRILKTNFKTEYKPHRNSLAKLNRAISLSLSFGMTGNKLITKISSIMQIFNSNVWTNYLEI